MFLSSLRLDSRARPAPLPNTQAYSTVRRGGSRMECMMMSVQYSNWTQLRGVLPILEVSPQAHVLLVQINLQTGELGDRGACSCFEHRIHPIRTQIMNKETSHSQIQQGYQTSSPTSPPLLLRICTYERQSSSSNHPATEWTSRLRHASSHLAGNMPSRSETPPSPHSR